MNTAILLLLVASPVPAAGPRIHRDIAYAEPKNARQTLDVYAPSEGRNHPVVIWIHGGGWRRGDKANVQHKPRAFVERGFVFVSTNYRFVPDITVSEMTGDVARASRWVHDHAREYGGDPDSLFIMGHSAGAHLAALVCTDERYLKAEGLSLAHIKGCVPIDVGAYDVPKRIKESRSAPPARFQEIFGESDEQHRNLSPATHVASGKHIPSFLILHVAARPETRSQSHAFADRLMEAGVRAEVLACPGKTHGTINTELGLAQDQPTQAVFEFLAGKLKQLPKSTP